MRNSAWKGLTILALTMVVATGMAQGRHEHGGGGHGHENRGHESHGRSHHESRVRMPRIRLSPPHRAHSHSSHTSLRLPGRSHELLPRHHDGRELGRGPLLVVEPHQRHSHLWWVHHRRNVENEWETLAIGAGLLGAIGLLEHDRTLVFVGAAGALYSIYRLDQDRASVDRHRRLRAMYFSRPYFWRNGVCYQRRTVRHGGQEFYQFVRA